MHISYFYDMPLPSPLAAAIQILHTCHALCEQGASVTVYTGPIMAGSIPACLAFYGLAPHPRLSILPVFRPGRHGWLPARAVRQALAAVPSTQRQYVVSRGESGIAVFSQMQRWPRPRNQRHVYEAHRLCFPEVARHASGLRARALGVLAWRRRQMRRREAQVVARADGLVCLTEGVRAALAREFGPAGPTLVLPSGTALPQHALPADAARDIDVLYVGKLERRKGVHDLVAAMQYLPGRALWLVGGSAEEVMAIQRLAQALGVAGQVIARGWVPPHAVPQLFDRARVGVCPLPVGENIIAEQFTSPLKVMSMLAHGLPIIGTDVPTLRAVLDHKRTALLAPPSDPPALAAAIQRLLCDRALAGQLGRAAQAESVQYSWQRRAERLLVFLEQLV